MKWEREREREREERHERETYSKEENSETVKFKHKITAIRGTKINIMNVENK